MSDNPETITASLQRNYVKDRLPILSLILCLQLGLLAASLGFIYYQMTSPPKPIFFQATANKQIIEPTSLAEPAITNAAMLNWAIEAIRITYSFNYHSITNHLARIAPYFDERGLTRFFTVIANDPNIKQVKPEKLIVSIQAREAPKITHEGKIEGRYAWQVILPMTVNYENAAIFRRQNIDIELYIWRVPTNEAPIGIKITNFTFEEK